MVVRLSAGETQARVGDIDDDLIRPREREVLCGHGTAHADHDVDAGRIGLHEERQHGPFGRGPRCRWSGGWTADAGQSNRRGGKYTKRNHRPLTFVISRSWSESSLVVPNSSIVNSTTFGRMLATRIRPSLLPTRTLSCLPAFLSCSSATDRPGSSTTVAMLLRSLRVGRRSVVVSNDRNGSRRPAWSYEKTSRMMTSGLPRALSLVTALGRTVGPATPGAPGRPIGGTLVPGAAGFTCCGGGGVFVRGAVLVRARG